MAIGILAGCSGGGGGGGGASSDSSGAGGGDGAISISNPPVVTPRASFHTAEYGVNYGLGSINASAAYAVGGTGEDITVAVIDTGVDIDHPDLAPNLHPASIDIANNGILTLDDQDGHGTGVVGIVAARKNDSGMHGVSYEAEVLAIRADSATAGLCADTTCGFTHSDLADAVDYAVANGARIINLSLGGAVAPGGEYEEALRDAVNAGVIIVAASGNDRDAALLYPARFAGDTALSQGLILAVGSVDQNDADSHTHSLAGATADYFLVAPGVGIVTTGIGGGTQTVTGTSFATPHVTGALALLLDIFPTLTPQQAVTLLLSTATDLGAAGTDDIFGRGLVNLEAAVQPQGTLGIPETAGVSGPRSDAAATSLSLGAAFGDALAGSPLLGRAIALDAYDRAYSIDLAQGIRPTERTFDIEGMLRQNRYRTMGLPIAGGHLSLSFGVTDFWTSSDETDFGRPDEEDERAFDNVRLAATTGHGLTMRFGHSIAAGQELGPRYRSGGAGLFWADDELLTPHLGLVGRGDHVGFDRRLDDATVISFDYFHGEEDEDFPEYAGEGEIMQVALGHRFASGLGIRFGIAHLEEDRAFLDSYATGGFGSAEGSTSQFYTLSGVMPLAPGLDFFAGITAGTTEMPETRSLLRDWSRVDSSAFGLGLVRTGLLDVDDRLGFIVGQPLRVEHASAMLAVPVARDLDGRVYHEATAVDALPSGREIDLQLAYDRQIMPGWSASSWLMMRLEPGHQKDADPAFGAGVMMRMEF